MPGKLAALNEEQDALGEPAEVARGDPMDSPADAYEALAAPYPERSCLLFPKRSQPRRACLLLVHHPWFTCFILAIILANCVTLALSSSREGFDTTPLGRALVVTDVVMLAIFAAEMVLKIVAMGFVMAPNTYLRDGWNVLDFLVVAMGVVSLVTPSNLTAIRTIRALRPLRTVNRVRGMKVLVTTIFGSLPMLMDVFVLCAFTFFMFGIVAVQLFAGILRFRCGTPDFTWATNITAPDGQISITNVSYVVPDDQTDDTCSGPLSSEVMWSLVDGVPTPHPGSNYRGRVCPPGMYCTDYGNPGYGFLSYDNILWAWLTIFQNITLSAWSNLMYMVQDALSYWSFLFFSALVIFGAFFMINLALAVLAVKFGSDKEADEKAHEEAKHADDTAMVAVGHVPSALAKDVTAKPRPLHGEEGRADDGDGDGAGDGESDMEPHGEPPPGLGRVRRVCWRIAVSKGLEYTTALLIVANTVIMCINWYQMPESVEQATNYANYALTIYFLIEMIVKLTGFGFKRYFSDGMNVFDFIVVVVSVVEMILDIIPSVSGLGPLSVLRAFRLLRVFRLARSWKELHVVVTGMFKSVQASLMLVLLMLLFLFIAALVGMQLFGYRFMFCSYVEGAAPVCPPGEAVWGQCPNHFDCYLPCAPADLDAWVEAPGSAYNDLAYCQIFCATPQAQALAAAGNASDADVAAAGGCSYLAQVGKSQVPRANFDNLFWGLYTVFQLLTGENWNDVMYDAMRTLTPWACLYFISIIVIGNYLVFNLFIAILLDNLSFTEEIKAHKEARAAAKSAAGSQSGSKSGTKSGRQSELVRSDSKGPTGQRQDRSRHSLAQVPTDDPLATQQGSIHDPQLISTAVDADLDPDLGQGDEPPDGKMPPLRSLTIRSQSRRRSGAGMSGAGSGSAQRVAGLLTRALTLGKSAAPPADAEAAAAAGAGAPPLRVAASMPLAPLLEPPPPPLVRQPADVDVVHVDGTRGLHGAAPSTRAEAGAAAHAEPGAPVSAERPHAGKASGMKLYDNPMMPAAGSGSRTDAQQASSSQLPAGMRLYDNPLANGDDDVGGGGGGDDDSSPSRAVPAQLLAYPRGSLDLPPLPRASAPGNGSSLDPLPPGIGDRPRGPSIRPVVPPISTAPKRRGGSLPPLGVALTRGREPGGEAATRRGAALAGGPTEGGGGTGPVPGAAALYGGLARPPPSGAVGPGPVAEAAEDGAGAGQAGAGGVLASRGAPRSRLAAASSARRDAGGGGADTDGEAPGTSYLADQATLSRISRGSSGSRSASAPPSASITPTAARVGPSPFSAQPSPRADPALGTSPSPAHSHHHPLPRSEPHPNGSPSSPHGPGRTRANAVSLAPRWLQPNHTLANGTHSLALPNGSSSSFQPDGSIGPSQARTGPAGGPDGAHNARADGDAGEEAREVSVPRIPRGGAKADGVNGAGTNGGVMGLVVMRSISSVRRSKLQVPGSPSYIADGPDGPGSPAVPTAGRAGAGAGGGGGEGGTGGGALCRAVSGASDALSPSAITAASESDPGEPAAWLHKIEGRSLFAFDPGSRFRLCMARVVHHPVFDGLILLTIAASCVCLVLDSPTLDQGSTLARVLEIFDYVFIAIFTIEAAMKIVTFGFAFTGKHAYIRNAWNVLDFAIVLLGYVLVIIDAVGVDGSNLKMLRVLRALRALRPLRAASKFEGLRLVVGTLFAVVPSMVNVALVCLLFFLIFAILSVNLFKGELYNCIDADTGERLDPAYVLPPGQPLTQAWCEPGLVTVTASAYHSAINVTLPPYNLTTQWINPIANFDNVGIAMLTLFQVSTLSLWVDITFTAVDAVAPQLQPLWNHRPVFVVFFILFIIICTFFVLNLFVGVTLDKFTEMQEATDRGGLLLTHRQAVWVATQKALLKADPALKPPPPEHPFRRRVHRVIASKQAEWFIMGVILANIVFMALVHYDMSETWQAVMSYSNLAFTIIFTIEATLKLIGFGPLTYFQDWWNAFDFFVTLVSIASVVLDFASTQNLAFMPVLRVLRVVRVLRLIRGAKGMRKLLRTLFYSLPALANVGGVMLLFFFIFAVIGVSLFADIKYGEALNRHANFNTFPNAMLLLFRMITGESWDQIMQDCMITTDCILITSNYTLITDGGNITLSEGSWFSPGAPELDGVPPDLQDNECPLSPFVAVIYFPLFVILCTFILLQLVIAVLLENLMITEHDADLPVNQVALDSFVAAWAHRDGRRRGLMHAAHLPAVVMETLPPLGTRGKPGSRAAARTRILRIDIPIYEGNMVSFIEVLHSLAGSVCGAVLPGTAEKRLYDQLAARLPDKEPLEGFSAAHYVAADAVRAAVRGFLLRYQHRAALRDLSASQVASRPHSPHGDGLEDQLPYFNQGGLPASVLGLGLGLGLGLAIDARTSVSGEKDDGLDRYGRKTPDRRTPDRKTPDRKAAARGQGRAPRSSSGGGAPQGPSQSGAALQPSDSTLVNGRRLADVRAALASGSFGTAPAPRRLEDEQAGYGAKRVRSYSRGDVDGVGPSPRAAAAAADTSKALAAAATAAEVAVSGRLAEASRPTLRPSTEIEAPVAPLVTAPYAPAVPPLAGAAGAGAAATGVANGGAPAVLVRTPSARGALPPMQWPPHDPAGLPTAPSAVPHTLPEAASRGLQVPPRSRPGSEGRPHAATGVAAATALSLRRARGTRSGSGSGSGLMEHQASSTGGASAGGASAAQSGDEGYSSGAASSEIQPPPASGSGGPEGSRGRANGA
ncbi:hypothetical protein HYH03_006076 [Edaphochlamys debaryana]|uniref:Ion transport domain-containing protein n=1 Tax=Edaphochlamys debaryana TaxID=47281 RepID=A0A836C1F3_9CHLO|nr:hypothetical protein HYH03_006076 [Edaphochlamys debaryana]|eukprot:KAG2495837.1 hypothetical protein HYH03_006076 [Edaphochlamys debaryana]